MVETAPKGASVWNIANALTLLRLVMVPVFVLALLESDVSDSKTMWRCAALVLFVAALGTDYLDGVLARAYQLITPFGQLMDPIADKALTGAAWLGLSYLGMIPWWVTIVILGRELGITLLRLWVIRRGVIPASRGGKIKTVLQGVTIAWYLTPWYAWDWEFMERVSPVLLTAALLATVMSGLDYVRSAWRGAREENDAA
ncbi:MAG: CDP-diacylglycerol--glycerol-3-phosphate 3-phosphatidyltransferase [Corynebacteriales bacterium]|nr:CDP-diacylglycerol--glycerol-3-phosphate 3-phosphatidyltransferase [Mycobacteriales bacterium]